MGIWEWVKLYRQDDTVDRFHGFLRGTQTLRPDQVGHLWIIVQPGPVRMLSGWGLLQRPVRVQHPRGTLDPLGTLDQAETWPGQAVSLSPTWQGEIYEPSFDIKSSRIRIPKGYTG